MVDKKPKYIDGVGWRYETEHSMLRRMAEHDYQSRCIYMLTLTLEDRSKDTLGRLKWKTKEERGSRAATNGTATERGSLAASNGTSLAASNGTSLAATNGTRTEADASFAPTALGLAVMEEWKRLETEHPQLHVIRLQLMPEHLHVVLFVKERIERPLGKYIGIFKNRCNKHYWQELTAKGLLGPKGEEAPPSLFSEGFTDSILMHDGQLEAQIRYVEQNPYRALVKGDNRELFKQVSNLVVYRERGSQAATNRTRQAATNGTRQAATNRTRQAATNRTATNGTTTNGTTANGASTNGASLGSGSKELGSFAAIGNRWLLDKPMRMQVRCHNNQSPENLRLIEKQKAYFLDRGMRGGVVVSPCISAGEKEIARAALDAGVPLIVILENGFPPMYKPPGKYFEACAKGLLLMLAPWPYHMERRKISRAQCLALNDMAFALSTEPWTDELEMKLKTAI